MVAGILTRDTRIRDPLLHQWRELLDAVWGHDEAPYTRTVDVHIARLRQKLPRSKSQRLIVTIRGRGYKFVG